jgi:RNA-directed DNA polymerase
MVSKRSDEAEVPARVAEAGGAGRKPRTKRGGAELGTATSGRTKSEDHRLMEEVVERSNLQLAYQRVLKNKGAPGVDDVSVCEFKGWLKMHWPSVKKALLEGRYLPRPVLRVDIPKPDGGVRTLGVPTVIDRLIQQALHQVLQLDIDLEKFFDRVNHDVLMARVARQVSDARVLKLIRRFLEAGMMSEGLVEQCTEGTPQGGPLSPLLSNILLNDLDQELEGRKLAFCRYADDCNVYVRSRVAGNRVMSGIRKFLEDVLTLRINPKKSAVARPWERKFLGFSVTVHRETRLRIAPASVQRLMQKVRDVTHTGRGRSLAHTIEDLNPLLRGWINYFKLTQAKGVLEELDSWMRRRLRCLLWRQWKRRATRGRKLRSLGLDAARARQSSSNGQGPWWNAGASHMNQALPAKYFTHMGLVSLMGLHQRLQSLS